MAVKIETDLVYNDEDLFHLLHVSQPFLLKARRSGALKFSRIGNRPVYLGEWVVTWIKSLAEDADKWKGKAGVSEK